MIDNIVLVIEPKKEISLEIEAKTGIELEVQFPTGKHYPVYEGDYIVTPKVFEQSLETADHLMEDDVTVLEIPYAEVSNPHGTTVTIAYM